MRMDKPHFAVADLLDASDEAACWQAEIHQARLEVLELMRQVMYGYDPSTARIERLFEAQREHG